MEVRLYNVPAHRSPGRLDTARRATLCAGRRATTTTLSKNSRHAGFDSSQMRCRRQAFLQCMSAITWRRELARTSHQVWTMLEGRGFSPAEIAAPALYTSRAPRSLRLQAARGAGHRNNREGFVTAALKPRPSAIPLGASRRGENSGLE